MLNRIWKAQHCAEYDLHSRRGGRNQSRGLCPPLSLTMPDCLSRPTYRFWLFIRCRRLSFPLCVFEAVLITCELTAELIHKSVDILYRLSISVHFGIIFLDLKHHILCLCCVCLHTVTILVLCV